MACDGLAPGVGAADGLEHDVVVGEPLGGHRSRRLGLRPALGVAVGERDGAALGDEQRGEHLAHRAAAEDAGVGGDLACGRAVERVDGGGERLGHRGGGGLQAVGDGVQGLLGRRHQLGEAAQQPARVAADLRPAGLAVAAGAAGDRVADQHPLARVLAQAGHLVAEAGRGRRVIIGCPRRHILTSVPQVVAASIRTSTSPGPGTGSATSSTRRSSSPNSSAALTASRHGLVARRRHAGRRAPRRSPRGESVR